MRPRWGTARIGPRVNGVFPGVLEVSGKVFGIYIELSVGVQCVNSKGSVRFRKNRRDDSGTASLIYVHPASRWIALNLYCTFKITNTIRIIYGVRDITEQR